MTVSSTTNKNIATADGILTVFTYGFKIFANTELLVTTTDPVTNVETTQVLTTNYTVQGVGETAGGTITFVSGAPTDTHIVTITRNISLVQNTTYKEVGKFPASSHEDALDRGVMISQKQEEELDRALKAPASVAGFDGQLPAATPNKAVIINATGDGVTLSDDDFEDSAADAAASAAAALVSENNAAASEAAAAASAATSKATSVNGSILWDFDTSTAMADPGTGNMRLNNAAFASVTQIAVSASSSVTGNPDVSDFVATWGDALNNPKGHIIIKKDDTPENFVIFLISGVITDNGTWIQIPVTEISSAGSIFSASDLMLNDFSRYGDDGAFGTGIDMLWDTATADSDQGSGKVWMNNSDPVLTTVLYVSDEDVYTNDISTFVGSWDDADNSTKGIVYISQTGNGANQVVYKITGTSILGTGYTKLTVTPLVSNGTLNDDDPVAMAFAAYGSDGRIFSPVDITGQPGGTLSLTDEIAFVDPSVGSGNLSDLEYTLKNFDLSSEENNPRGLGVSGDNLTFFVSGQQQNEVQQYDMTSPMDLFGATYSGNSLNVFPEVSGNVEEVQISPDGTRLYICATGVDSLFQYNLTVANDLTTATYSGNSFSVSSEDTNPRGIAFKPDGTKFWMVGNANDTVYQYTMSTPWDLSTSSYDTLFFDAGAHFSFPTGVAFLPDGTTMYVCGGQNDKIIAQYTLSTPWNVQTSSFVTSVNVSDQENTPQGLAVRADGAKLFLLGNASDSVSEYVMGGALRKDDIQGIVDLAMADVTNQTSKGTPVGADELLIQDSAASFVPKKATITSLLAGLPSATTSVEGIVELATDAEYLTGTDTTRAITASNLGSNQTLAADGFKKFSNGMIIQWGATGVYATSTTVNFPTAFSSAVYAVVFGGDYGTAIGFPAYVQAGTVTLTSFVARSGTGSNTAQFYIAIGK